MQNIVNAFSFIMKGGIMMYPLFVCVNCVHGVDN